MDTYIWYEDFMTLCGEQDGKEGYGEDETAAMRDPECMTPASFEKCLSTSVRLDDFDCYFRLIDEFPAFFDAYNRKLERLIRYSGERSVF